MKKLGFVLIVLNLLTIGILVAVFWSKNREGTSEKKILDGNTEILVKLVPQQESPLKGNLQIYKDGKKVLEEILGGASLPNWSIVETSILNRQNEKILFIKLFQGIHENTFSHVTYQFSFDKNWTLSKSDSPQYSMPNLIEIKISLFLIPIFFIGLFLILKKKTLRKPVQDAEK